jgi:hypothetical protein
MATNLERPVTKHFLNSVAVSKLKMKSIQTQCFAEMNMYSFQEWWTYASPSA